MGMQALQMLLCSPIIKMYNMQNFNAELATCYETAANHSWACIHEQAITITTLENNN
jgi:hypothetical protein